MNNEWLEVFSEFESHWTDRKKVLCMSKSIELLKKRAQELSPEPLEWSDKNIAKYGDMGKGFTTLTIRAATIEVLE